jgi:uncharacterized membrane protein YagU involved in acid resistance
MKKITQFIPLVYLLSFDSVFATTQAGIPHPDAYLSSGQIFLMRHVNTFPFWFFLLLTIIFAIVYAVKKNKFRRVSFWISFVLALVTFVFFAAPAYF